jgi:hypothetical protein
MLELQDVTKTFGKQVTSPACRCGSNRAWSA